MTRQGGRFEHIDLYTYATAPSQQRETVLKWYCGDHGGRRTFGVLPFSMATNPSEDNACISADCVCARLRKHRQETRHPAVRRRWNLPFLGSNALYTWQQGEATRPPTNRWAGFICENITDRSEKLCLVFFSTSPPSYDSLQLYKGRQCSTHSKLRKTPSIILTTPVLQTVRKSKEKTTNQRTWGQKTLMFLGPVITVKVLSYSQVMLEYKMTYSFHLF